MDKQIQIANYLLETKSIVSYVDYGNQIHCEGYVKSFHVNNEKGKIEVLLKIAVTDNYDTNRQVQLMIPPNKTQMKRNLIEKMENCLNPSY